MKRLTRLMASLAAAGLGLSTILSANAANIMSVAKVANAALTAGADRAQEALRSDEQMQASVVLRAIDQMLSAGSYSEGDAVAVVRGSAAPAVSESAELLMHAGPDAVKGAIETETVTGSLSADLARQRLEEKSRHTKEEGDEYSIWLVSDPGETTKELLRELYADPDVISAEPNYVTYAAEEPATKELVVEEPAAAVPATWVP